MELSNEKDQKLILLCVLLVVGISFVVAGLSGLTGLKIKQVENVLIEKIRNKLPDHLELKYKKIKFNLLSQQAVIPDLTVYNKNSQCNDLMIRKVSIKASGNKDNIPLSGSLYLDGISTSKENMEQAFSLAANPKVYAFLENYFSGSQLSMGFKYSFDYKKEILNIKKISVEFGKKIRINFALSFGNVALDDIKKIIKSGYKANTIPVLILIQKFKPLRSDISYSFNLDKINVKELLSAFDLRIKDIQAACNTAGFPEYFNLILKQHASSDEGKKCASLHEFLFGFEPGLFISLQFDLQNVDSNNINAFSEIEIDKFKLQLIDKDGFDTAYKITSDMRNTSEEQLKTEFKNNIESMFQMYGLETFLGENINSLKDFLFTGKDTLTIKTRKKIKVNQFMMAMSDQKAIPRLIKDFLVFE